MNQTNNFTCRTTAMLAILITMLITGAAARASVVPRVCVDAPYRTGTVTLASASAAGDLTISVNGYVPPFVSLVINPGGATQETVPYVKPLTDTPFAVNAQGAFSVSGGFVQMPLTYSVPFSGDCNTASQYGQNGVDAGNNKLYICTATGWKFTVLQ